MQDVALTSEDVGGPLCDDGSDEDGEGHGSASDDSAGSGERSFTGSGRVVATDGIEHLLAQHTDSGSDTAARATDDIVTRGAVDEDAAGAAAVATEGDEGTGT